MIEVFVVVLWSKWSIGLSEITTHYSAHDVCQHIRRNQKLDTDLTSFRLELRPDGIVAKKVEIQCLAPIVR